MWLMECIKFSDDAILLAFSTPFLSALRKIEIWCIGQLNFVCAELMHDLSVLSLCIRTALVSSASSHSSYVLHDGINNQPHVS